MDKEKFNKGIELLKQPIMPLVSMVQFLFMTGPFTRISEVIDELPEPIETGNATYEQPKAILSEYLEILEGYERLKEGSYPVPRVVDEQNNPVDPFTAGTVVVQQQLLRAELEKINSVLCGPCRCTLCCVGPEQSMQQEFFEIPVSSEELDLFSVKRCDNEASRNSLPMDEKDFLWEGRPFYRIAAPVLIHWKKGWSMIMPKGSRCPNLNDKGQCKVYTDRPDVCRRPQIFPYMVEPVDDIESDVPMVRIRQSLLAIIDCPYVQELKDVIGEYAAASELHFILKQNKE